MLYMGLRNIAAATLVPVLLTSLSSCAEPAGSGNPPGSSSSSAPAAQSPAAEAPAEGVDRYSVEVLDTHPYDPTAFTQGLEVEPDGTLLVGTGMRGESRIYRTTLDGEQSHSHDLDDEFFGEGLTRHGDTVWQLTWQEGVAFERDAETLEEVGRANYEGEGWGLCSRQDELIMSDGTEELRRIDPDTFAERERFQVTLGGEAVDGINELECVGDDVYANVFMTTDILRIDAESGEVTAVIDASGVPDLGDADDPNSVLNGIAHIPDTDRFYLGGKLWTGLHEVRFVPEG